MSAHGTVRSWDDEEGWGIIDSVQTPGGCWAHFTAVAVEGYRKLSPGQQVVLEWEAADQDGFSFRATKAWPAGQEPVGAAPQDPGATYSSTLTIRFNQER